MQMFYSWRVGTAVYNLRDDGSINNSSQGDAIEAKRWPTVYGGTGMRSTLALDDVSPGRIMVEETAPVLVRSQGNRAKLLVAT